MRKKERKSLEFLFFPPDVLVSRVAPSAGEGIC